MFDRENAVGLLLLGLCVAVGAVMVFAIATDTEFRYTGPDWLAWVLVILFLGGALFGIFAGRGGRRWPDPLSGRGGWRRLFRRDRDGE